MTKTETMKKIHATTDYEKPLDPILLDLPSGPSAADAIFEMMRYKEVGYPGEEIAQALWKWLDAHSSHKREAIAYVIGDLLRLVQLKEMPYKDYLQTPEWRLVARETKDRFGGTCALDARHPAEHAHHRTYVRLGRERPEDVIPLCRDCHARHHDISDGRASVTGSPPSR